MKRRATLLAAAAVASLSSSPHARAADPAPGLEEILITGSLREARVEDLPASISVLEGADLEGGGAQHFGDALALIPNFNWSGGTSRPRYFQIRGIGELEQYQGAPNPSVGFLIDDIDFSGVAMPATLFDVERVEVLRGPQGTAYGANALAGLVNMVSRAPRRQFEGRLEAEAGDYGARSGGLVLNDALGDTAAWRVAAHAFRGDGFRRNAFLGRDDTNGFDEAFVRGRLRLEPREDLAVNFTALWSDIDNGYDAWSLDNSRTTLSDRPGRDAQRSRAAAARVDYAPSPGVDLRSVTTFAESAIDYAFDGDWVYDAYWPDEDPPYDFYQEIRRERRTWSQLLRAGLTPDRGPQWIVGAYALRLSEDNAITDFLVGEAQAPLASDYVATSLAVFAQADQDVGRWSLSAGVRGEQREAHYADSLGASHRPRDRMVGGHVSATLHLRERTDLWVAVNRGYKAGGFNIGNDSVPADRRLFDPEYLVNVETGLSTRSADGRFDARGSLFYMRRAEQQVNTSLQLDPSDPLTFVQLTDNAARGENYGLELQAGWRPHPQLRVGASLGLLEARFLDYEVAGEDLAGTEQAHAPAYQYGLQAHWQHPRGPFARAELTGSDDFAFSDSPGNEERSVAYRLVNLVLGWRGERWTVSAWGRNLFDETWYPRGFFFGNEPPDWADRRYVQNGDPRRYGLTVAVDF